MAHYSANFLSTSMEAKVQIAYKHHRRDGNSGGLPFVHVKRNRDGKFAFSAKVKNLRRVECTITVVTSSEQETIYLLKWRALHYAAGRWSLSMGERIEDKIPVPPPRTEFARKCHSPVMTRLANITRE
ncbi:hypothetical protein HDE_10846 [Halotydeus destructor]|nr:hypothetical protein HDE_10846 [Halotydeus destructor]